MRWLFLTGLLLLTMLQYRLWIAEDGWREYRSLSTAVERQSRENSELHDRNERLAAEVQDLKEGMAAVEERARSELGMIQRDERFYQLVEANEKTAQTDDR